MKILFHWLIGAVAIIVAAYIVPGIAVTPKVALIAAVVLGALNLFIRPVLMILTLPINIITLGLFSLVINALLVMLTAYLVPGFVVVGFWQALLFALVLSIINWVFNSWGD
ncbi:MAG: phage holin family protein [Candidatus Paceibacterota bacterium]|jgi:putative membrane protein